MKWLNKIKLMFFIYNNKKLYILCLKIDMEYIIKEIKMILVWNDWIPYHFHFNINKCVNIVFNLKLLHKCVVRLIKQIWSKIRERETKTMKNKGNSFNKIIYCVHHCFAKRWLI